MTLEASMKTTISGIGSVALIAASFVSVALPITPAAAESASQTQCESTEGAVYVKDGPNSRCEYPAVTTKPGNTPDGYDGGAQTTTQDTTTGQGNLNNKPTTETTCTGHKCPK
jgi:hypothetical protein